MELKQAEEYAKEPGKIIDIGTCNLAQAVISGWITDREEEEYALRLMVDKHHDELFEKYQVNAVADRKIKISDIYTKWKETERQVKKWKRLLATLRDRFIVLTQTKRY